MKKPIVALTIFYCLGIILINYIRVNFWIIAVLTAVIIFLATQLSKSYIFLILTLFLALLIGGLSLKNSYILPKCHVSNFVYYKDSALYSLSGFIDDIPQIKSNQVNFNFFVREIQVGKFKWRCCGKLLVKTDFVEKLNYGDNLTLIGNLSRPANFNSASRSYKDYLGRQAIYLIMRIKDQRQIIYNQGNSGSKLIRSIFRLREKMEAIINRHLRDLPAAILSAMVLGQKRNIPWLINDSMVKSGTVHILVVSGFNVGIVAFIINLLFKILRIQKRLRIILAVVCLLIYCAITGASNPVIRATVMGVVFLLAYFSKRSPDMYNSLATAALFILIINPRQLFDAGFQLSFMSVLAIVYLYPKLKDFFHLENCKIKLIKFIYEGLLVSFSAWLGTLAIIALNFRIIAPVTVLANILIVPLATLITLCGFTLVLSGLICPSLASLFSGPTSMLINLLLNINAAVIKIPFAYSYLVNSVGFR